MKRWRILQSMRSRNIYFCTRNLTCNTLWFDTKESCRNCLIHKLIVNNLISARCQYSMLIRIVRPIAWKASKKWHHMCFSMSRLLTTEESYIADLLNYKYRLLALVQLLRMLKKWVKTIYLLFMVVRSRVVETVSYAI